MKGQFLKFFDNNLFLNNLYKLYDTFSLNSSIHNINLSMYLNQKNYLLLLLLNYYLLIIGPWPTFILFRA